MRANARNLMYVLLLVCAGCAQLTSLTGGGDVEPKTFAQRLTVAYVGAATMRQVTADLLAADQIDKKKAEALLAETDQIRAGLDTAKLAAGKGDLMAANGQLTAAITMLTVLETVLQAKDKK